jgi:hypothetical protein
MNALTIPTTHHPDINNCSNNKQPSDGTTFYANNSLKSGNSSSNSNVSILLSNDPYPMTMAQQAPLHHMDFHS